MPFTPLYMILEYNIEIQYQQTLFLLNKIQHIIFPLVALDPRDEGKLLT